MTNDPYQELKDKFDLMEYIISQGYVVNNKKSSSTWIVLKKGEDKLLYHTKKKFYQNPNIKEDQGDIISFVTNRVTGLVIPSKSPEDKYKAINILKGHNYNDHDHKLIKEQSRVVDKKELMTRIAKTDFSHAPLTDYSYLVQDRKLSKESIDSELFSGRVFNSYFRLEKNGHIITNFGFGKYKNDHLVGLEVRNKNLDHVAGLHDAIFHSNYRQFKQVDFVFIAESAIDAISHYELFKNIKAFQDKNLVYVSTGGNIYDEKINEIFSFFNQLNISENATFCSITDNDAKGFYYDHYLMAEFLKRFDNIEIKLNTNDHFHIYDFADIDRSKFEGLTHLVNKANEEIKQANPSPGYGDYFVLKIEGQNVKLHVPLSVQIKENPIQDFMKAVGFQKKIISHKPKEVKDWNDYLKVKKMGIEGSKKKTNSTNFKIKK